LTEKRIIIQHKNGKFLLVRDTTGVWSFLLASDDPVKTAQDDLGIDIELTENKKPIEIHGVTTEFIVATTKDASISEAGEIIETVWLERGIALERITYGDAMDVFEELTQ